MNTCQQDNLKLKLSQFISNELIEFSTNFVIFSEFWPFEYFGV